MKKIQIPAVFVCALLLFVLLFSAGCVEEEKPELTAAVCADIPPYAYYSGGSITGIDIAVLNNIADELEMDIRLDDRYFADLLPAVETGKDAIALCALQQSDISAYNISAHTEIVHTGITCTIPYLTTTQVIVYNAANPCTTDLTGKKAGVKYTTTADLLLFGNENYSETELVRMKKLDDLLDLLETGEIDCIVIDEMTADRLCKANSAARSLEKYETPLYTAQYVIAVSAENTGLLEKLNTCIEKMIQDKTIEQICKNYLP